MKKKISSYQKMKDKYQEKINELTNDIIILLEEKDFVKTHQVKMKWQTMINIEKSMWAGK